MIMGKGIPSARGCEFKGPMAAENFAKGFDNIPRNPDGTMVVDPNHDPVVDEKKNYPGSCSVCSIRESSKCPDSYGCQSKECLEHLEKYGQA